MPDAEAGLKRFFYEFSIGLAFSAGIGAIKETLGPQGEGLATFISLLIGVVGSYTLLRAMPYWGWEYLFGWLAGGVVTYWTGLLSLNDPFDLLIFFVVPIFIMLERGYRKVPD